MPTNWAEIFLGMLLAGIFAGVVSLAIQLIGIGGTLESILKVLQRRNDES